MADINLILADDHRIFSESLASMFGQLEGYHIMDIVENGRQLLDSLKQRQPDIIILDHSMPEMNGYEAAKIIISEYPKTRILMLTMHDNPAIIKPLIAIGVHGCLMKNASKQELVTAIDTLMAGKTWFSQEIMNSLALAIKQDLDVQLTKREKEVLQLLYEGMSTGAIAEKLFLSNHTVETHRKNLLSKCGCTNTPQLINLALKNRWIQ